MTVEKYWHSFRQVVVITFHSDDTVEISADMSWGPTVGLYKMVGKREALSDSYGWIRIERVDYSRWKTTPLGVPIESGTLLPLQPLEAELIYEYFKVTTSPVIPHPEDEPSLILAGHIGRNPTFDLLLVTPFYLVDALEDAKEIVGKGTIEDYLDEDVPEDDAWKMLDTELIRHYENLVMELDKAKFRKVDVAESEA